ncbi:MAG TPA: hypothetical protein VFT37_15625, partial [Telluria sp.]|nr:hypothetical protein [Telluria sp.]
MTEEMIIPKARAAFEDGNYGLCISLYEQAARIYPQWAESYNFTVESIRKRYPAFEFGASYDAVVKKVPSSPPNFPEWMKLPPLSGVANDYTYIESAAAQYWSNATRKPHLPVSIIIPV